MIVYSLVLIGIILVPLAFVLSGQPDVSLMITSAGILLVVLLVASFLFVPKAILIFGFVAVGPAGITKLDTSTISVNSPSLAGGMTVHARDSLNISAVSSPPGSVYSAGDGMKFISFPLLSPPLPHLFLLS